MHTILSLVAAGMGVAFAPEGRVRCGWTVWDGATDGNTECRTTSPGISQSYGSHAALAGRWSRSCRRSDPCGGASLALSRQIPRGTAEVGALKNPIVQRQSSDCGQKQALGEGLSSQGIGAKPV
ncbi:hypothetical protein [Sinorhizobium medicae]|uniref:hypothetical protein n=1 Tax=Sinorhizobium medicae TaxID=110321 RepID=UPI002B1BDD34|nr:hypothetical protein [Sinorhizobium medicae]